MHVKNKYSWIKHVDFMVLNILALLFSFVISFYFKFGSFRTMFSSRWMALLTVIILIDLTITLITNPYSGILRRPYYRDVIVQFLLTAYSFVIVAFMFYLLKIGAFYSRVTLVSTYVIYYFVSLLATYVRKKLILSGDINAFNIRERNLVAVIDYNSLDEIAENMNASDVKEYSIVGYCFPEGSDLTEFSGAPVIARDNLVDYVINHHIDDVYISVSTDMFNATEYKALVDNGVNVQLDIDNLLGISTDDQFISNVGTYRTLSVGPYAMDSNQAFYQIVKRGLDVILGIIGCILLIPIYIVVKISYLVTGDTKPIIYTHERVGQFGKEFKLYKFRTMVPDADKVLRDLLENPIYKAQWDANQKLDNDPRITTVGKFLRRTSLDEFPQFINVIRGDMAVVGPRPLVRGELEKHGGLTLYNKVKPGISGWWACNGRSNINYRERLELEYYYVKNCSLQLDVLVIARTILHVIKRDGAQ